MPQLLPLLRRRYPQIAKDLLAPLLDVLSIGRATCDGDLDKLLIVLVVGMRTVEHKDVETMDLEDVLSGAVETMPSLSTNVRSIADSTGIPKESVRRKVAALVAEGWIRRDANSLSLAPHAARMLTGLREQTLLLALRNHQVILSLEQTQER
ncbi:MAG: hypothetical protein JWQ97_1427 [Phenylobacterium sp.]|nr:hypothetical protein [Phenylobacterium sp.]